MLCPSQSCQLFCIRTKPHHGSGSRMMQPSTDKHIESKQISDSVVWKSSVHVAFTPNGMRRSTRKFALHIRNLILTLISDSRSDAGSSRFKSFRRHHLSPDVFGGRPPFAHMNILNAISAGSNVQEVRQHFRVDGLDALAILQDGALLDDQHASTRTWHRQPRILTYDLHICCKQLVWFDPSRVLH